MANSQQLQMHLKCNSHIQIILFNKKIFKTQKHDKKSGVLFDVDIESGLVVHVDGQCGLLVNDDKESGLLVILLTQKVAC